LVLLFLFRYFVFKNCVFDEAEVEVVVFVVCF